jgi:two-component system, NtrC family, sensor kinase
MIKWSFTFRRVSLRLFLLLSFLVFIVFSIIIYINSKFYMHQIEHNIRNQTIYASNLIKQTIRTTMLKNQREEIAQIISDIGKEHYVDGIRIFDKKKQIEYSDKVYEINEQVTKNSEQCKYCHYNSKLKKLVFEGNKLINIRRKNGERILEVINPIDNDPDCYNAPCHAHKKDEKLLGLLNINISLKELDDSAAQTRKKTFLFSGLLILVATIINGAFIRNQIQRPIAKLLDGIRQVTELNLDFILNVDSSDEIGDLATSFNKMTKRLRQYQKELQEWSNTLEDKVNEKTQELEKAQKQLILSEKMASMGKLAAIVAHEINNPISGILTYSKLISKNLKNNPTKGIISESIENLKIIEDELKRCGDIVKNLLIYSKKSFGERTHTDLKTVIKKGIELVKHKFKVRDIELVQDFTGEDTYFFCDSASIQQMVIDLLINGLEAYTQKGGKVKLGLYRDNKNKQFRLEISDNAVGIHEDLIPKIFEPFYSTKNSDKNTGLGLAVVYGIVQRHGGTIDVKSKLYEGTTFLINLPFNSD